MRTSRSVSRTGRHEHGAVNTDGKREIVGLRIGPSEAETFWSGFLKSLARRGLHSVKLVISDAHEGLKAAIRRVFSATWQRCRVHWMRNALSSVAKTQQKHGGGRAAPSLYSAGPGASQPDATPRCGPVAAEMAEARRLHRRQRDRCVVALGLPEQHRSKLHSTNPLERLNKEVKRRADVVGISLTKPRGGRC